MLENRGAVTSSVSFRAIGTFRVALGMVLAQALPAQPLAARWQAGQSWRVEYVRSVPSPRQEPSPPLSAHAPASSERFVWIYRVMDREAQQIRLQATEEGGAGKFDLWFNAPLVSFRRAVKIIDTRSIDLIVHPGPTSYFGWSAVYPLIFDWAPPPQSRNPASRAFTDDDGQRVAETIRFTSPSQFEIEMTVQRTIDAGYMETRRSRQSWMAGSPWWSEASIETERLIDGKKSDETNIRGRLIP